MQIAGVEQPDVVNAVLHHRQPLNARAKGKAGVNFRVNAAKAQNIGVNQAGA